MEEMTTLRTNEFMHITVRSGNTFDEVKKKLEASVPPLDTRFYTFVRQGDRDRALEILQALPPLSIFGSKDHGSLLIIADLKRRAIQYEIGNPLTASKMTRLHDSAALYAPMRVLLREDEEGVVAFEYDRPISVFGQFGDDRVNAVARQLDADLLSALELAAA